MIRKLSFIALAALFAITLFAMPAQAAANRLSNFPNGFPSGVNVQGLPLLNTYGGNVFWVDSGTGSNGNTGTFDRPFATIDYTVGRCTAMNGDIIMAKPGHAGDINSAGALDLDVAGITVIGLGNGDLRPTLTFSTVATADIDFDAPYITLHNFIIDMANSVTTTIAGIDVNYSNCTLSNCKIITSDAYASYAGIGISVDSNGDWLKILNNDFVGVAENGSAYTATAQVISFTSAPAFVDIIGNRFAGDYSTAAIYTTVEVQGLDIWDNYIRNSRALAHAIEFTGNATGVIRYNDIVTESYTNTIDPGYCETIENYWYDRDRPGDHSGILALPPTDPREWFAETGILGLPASTSSTMFTISGGQIEILAFIGEVTTAIQGQATTLTLLSAGAAGEVALCAALDLNADADGTIYSLTTSLTTQLGESLGAIAGMGFTAIVPPGTIRALTVATSSGAIRWRMIYRPLTTGVTVTGAI